MERDPRRQAIVDAYHNRLAEPRKMSEVIPELVSEGHSEDLVRSQVWYLLDQGELALTDNWRVQNGEKHTRQLDFLPELGENF